jgi:glycosyltransferase involved in cell wall biosynthesis
VLGGMFLDLGKVSVVMPVYNAQKYLKTAIESILIQSYTNFELILINDGSTDNSKNIIESFNDERIKLYNNDGNKGLIYSLNKAISLCEGRYIARMDSDDISNENRLKIQVEFLENNPEIGVISSNVIQFSDRYPIIKKSTKYNKDNDAIKCELLFRNRLIHPSVMLRASIVKNDSGNRYNPKHLMCEDFGLWQLLISKYKFFVTQENLVQYRMTNTSITTKSRNEIENFYKYQKEVYKQGLRILGIPFNDRELDIHTELSMATKVKYYKYTLQEKESWLKKVASFNSEINYFNHDALMEIMAEMFYMNCLVLNDYSYYKKCSFYKVYNTNKTKFKIDKFKLSLLNHVKKTIW